MNFTATHQATYTAKGETNTIYFTSEDALVIGLDTWFSIAEFQVAEGNGEYRTYGDALVVKWGEVTELVFVCRCGTICNQAVKKNGGFRPGHDAKMVSWLAGNVKSGEMSAEWAVDQLVDRPALQAKLLKQIG